MSALLMGAVFYTDLPAHLKFTLLALADEADDDGASIFIGQRRLGIKIGHSERSVRANLAELRDLGWVRRLIERHPKYGTDQYEILVDKLPGQRPPAAVSAGRAPATIAARKPTSATPRQILPVAPTPTGSPLPGGTGSPLPPTHERTLPVSKDLTDAAAPRPRARARDLIFEALCTIEGHGWQDLNSTERGKLNKARRLAAESDATPETIHRAADRWPAVIGGRRR